MYALASTTCTILRGTQVNDWGDVTDDPSGGRIVASGVPVSLAITNTSTRSHASQDIRAIRTISGAIQSDTDVVATDRLRDDRTGAIYEIESVTDTLGPALVGDLQLVLTRVN